MVHPLVPLKKRYTLKMIKLLFLHFSNCLKKQSRNLCWTVHLAMKAKFPTDRKYLHSERFIRDGIPTEIILRYISLRFPMSNLAFNGCQKLDGIVCTLVKCTGDFVGRCLSILIPFEFLKDFEDFSNLVLENSLDNLLCAIARDNITAAISDGLARRKAQRE